MVLCVVLLCVDMLCGMLCGGVLYKTVCDVYIVYCVGGCDCVC